MSRAVSIHVGVDRAHGRHGNVPLRRSEELAWRMAELASQAGYRSQRVIRGADATRQALHRALVDAAESLEAGGTLLITFNGHGCQETDADKDERGPVDQGWCLSDGVMIDDRLVGYWRLFNEGVRIVVVSESCYSGGVVRDDHPAGAHAPPSGPRPPVMRGDEGQGDGYGHGKPVYRSVDGEAGSGGPCTVTPSRQNDGIRASLLLLAASRDNQKAQEGLFSECLLKLWAGGRFQGSYWDLSQKVKDEVLGERPGQEPQILMLGTPDREFPLQRAFHLGAAAVPGTDATDTAAAVPGAGSAPVPGTGAGTEPGAGYGSGDAHNGRRDVLRDGGGYRGDVFRGGGTRSG